MESLIKKFQRTEIVLAIFGRLATFRGLLLSGLTSRHNLG